jgi:hypothetical protein
MQQPLLGKVADNHILLSYFMSKTISTADKEQPHFSLTSLENK